MLQSPFRIKEIVDAAAEMGFRHAALTDEGNMFGVMPFYKECRRQNIHPIIGCEFHVRYDENLAKDDEKRMHLLFLAKNDAGLQNLYRMSTAVQCGQNISLTECADIVQECVVLTSGDSDAMQEWLDHENETMLRNYLQKCAALWPDFYVSIAMNDSAYWREKNKQLKQIAKSLSIPTVALSRIYYRKPDDMETLRLLQAIDKGTTIDDQSLDVKRQRYYRSAQEMDELYDADDLAQTDRIAAMCNVQMSMPKSEIPHFENPKQVDNVTYLRALCRAGLKKRMNGRVPEEYAQRLDHELKVIVQNDFTDYFLIVWDYIREARHRGIYVGPGRGSAAGSLVAYCMGITHVDPIKNHLFFERFLNAGRKNKPDIDTDFPDDRIDEMFKYLDQKYGSDHVARIITYSNLKAKKALNDTAKAMNYPVQKLKELTAHWPKKEITLQEMLKRDRSFAGMVQHDAQTNLLFRRACAIEGLPRHVSTHAAGVVLSDQPIINVCPLAQIGDTLHATQFSAAYLEELGLIKFDLLSLHNLTTIHAIITDLEKYEHIHIDPLKLPLNDAKTYQMLAQGNTIGVFQLESEGISDLLKQLHPTCFEDISTILALYRPGPMQNRAQYMENRRHPDAIQYIDPRLKPILQETYGIILYQEQIMQIAQVIAGFSLEQADQLRRAMSKKEPEVMQSYHEAFIEGAAHHHCSRKTAEQIFDWIARFADYGFNKSHSYAYGMITYQMAYLKANYPLYFFANLLDGANRKKIAEILAECRKMNVKIYGPDVQSSQSGYRPEKNGLRMPLTAIRGIREKENTLILNEREKGPFKDYIDFMIRVSAQKLEQKEIESLIDGGALDCFGLTRETMRDPENLNSVLTYADLVTTSTEQGAVFRYDLVSPPRLKPLKENDQHKARREYDVLGFYLTEHPIQKLRKRYQCRSIRSCEDFRGYVRVIGEVVRSREHTTKQGNTMCFLTIKDESGTIDAALMPRIYEREKEKITKGAILLIKGRITSEYPNSISVNQIDPIEINESE